MQVRPECHDGKGASIVHTLRNPIICNCWYFYSISNDGRSDCGGSRSDISSSGGGVIGGPSRSDTGRSGSGRDRSSQGSAVRWNGVSGIAIDLLLDAWTNTILRVLTKIGVDVLVDVSANVFTGIMTDSCLL